MRNWEEIYKKTRKHNIELRKLEEEKIKKIIQNKIKNDIFHKQDKQEEIDDDIDELIL